MKEASVAAGVPPAIEGGVSPPGIPGSWPQCVSNFWKTFLSMNPPSPRHRTATPNRIPHALPSSSAVLRSYRDRWPILALACALWIAHLTLASAAQPGSRSIRIPVSVDSGFFTQPFHVTLPAQPQLHYTTNGTSPLGAHAIPYTGPVPIDSTTILRVAFQGTSSPPLHHETRTFLFLSHVLRQTGAGFPTTWGTNDGKAVPADYAMDPEVVDHPAYRDRLIPALESLPSISLVVDPHDLLDPDQGIYSNPRESGADWERPATVEFLGPTTRPAGATRIPTGQHARSGPAADNPALRINCGVRIQGGWNRRPEESPKHAFRLIFRKEYGSGKWKAPLFQETGAREFDELILRAGCNNTWLHWSGEERHRGDYLRDQWMRDSLAAMDHPSARGRFVHLYLNGLYWGVYNLAERPSAPFVAAHFGGSPDDYDARNGSNVIEGDDVVWRELMALAETSATHAELYPEIARRLDLRAFADFFLLNLYGANGDWDGSSNWYAARRRSPPGPYRFFVWDGERTLEGLHDHALGYDADDSPPRLFQRLRKNPLFQKVFRDRARLHLTGNGALTPERAAARFRQRAAELDLAIIAESARWGDYRRDAHPYKTGPYTLYTRDEHWRPEIDRLLHTYFPGRTEVLIEQLRAADLWANP